MFNHSSIFQYSNFAENFVCILYTVHLYISFSKQTWLAGQSHFQSWIQYIFIHCPSFIASHVSWSQSVFSPRPTECMLILFLLRTLPCMFSDLAPNGWNLRSHTLWGREYVKIAFRNHDFINIGFYRLSGTWYKSHSRIESLLEKMSELCNFWNLCKSRRNNDFCQNTVKTPHHMVLAPCFLPCFLWFPLVLSAWQRFRLQIFSSWRETSLLAMVLFCASRGFPAARCVKMWNTASGWHKTWTKNSFFMPPRDKVERKSKKITERMMRSTAVMSLAMPNRSRPMLCVQDAVTR